MKIMKPNEGTADRIIRLILGVVLIIIGWPVLGNNTLGIILDIIGVLLLITGITGFCTVYKILGINTLKVPKEK
jgi:uncharacterized membrane protein HdeD (DUF308 family)